MSYTRFENDLLVAAYFLGEETGQDSVSVKEVLHNFSLSPRANWIMRALEAFVSYGYSMDVRHIGEEIEQDISLTSRGLREAERLIDEGVGPARILRTSEAPSRGQPEAPEYERLLQQIIPASDRIVTPSHNAPDYVLALEKVQEARRLIEQSNQLSEDEKADTLVHLDAGLSILTRARNFTVGAIRYLILDRLKKAFEGAIEDAFKAAIVGTFMTLATILIWMIGS